MNGSESLRSSDVCSDTQKKDPPSFFKIMLQDFKNVLFIPPKFACNIGCLVKQTVHLRDSNGNSWKVKISVMKGRLAFQDGWRDFVRAHSITNGEFVVFKYEGHSVFTVQIWGTDACERIYFNGKVKKGSIKAKRKASVSPHENIHLLKKQRTCEASEYKCKFEKFDSSEKVRKEKVFSPDMFGKAKNPHKPVICKEKKVPNNSATLSHVIDEDAVDHVAADVSAVPFRVIPCDKVTTEAENNIHGIGLSDPNLPVLSRPRFLQQKCYKIGVDDLIEQNEVCNFLVTEDGVCHIFDENLTNEIAPSLSNPKENNVCNNDKMATSKEPVLHRENVPDVPYTKSMLEFTEGESRRLTATDISKKPRGKGVRPILALRENSDHPNKSSMLRYDNQPHITKRFSHQFGKGSDGNREEMKEKPSPSLKGKTIQEKVESKELMPLPFADFRFSFSLTEQAVWVALPVKLPSQFGKGKHWRKMILLRDPYTRLWPVVYMEDLKFVGFIGGWEQFTRANRLKIGDRCDFEIAFELRHTLQVQISPA